jgi:drug/metabolite transporter (DMT)-like permease
MELSLPVALAVLGGATLHASWNALVKSSADKQLDTIAVTSGAGVLGLVGALVLPAPAPASWPWIAASAVVHIGYFWTLSSAYRYGDLSFTYPIMRGGGPALVALASGLVFGEVLSGPQAAGVLLVCVGILAFATHPARDPMALRHSLVFALANAVMVAAYTLVDAQGVRRSGAALSYTCWFFVVNGLVIFSLGTLLRGRAVPRYLMGNGKRALLGGACTFGSYSIALWAMTQAPVALVAVLRETSVLLAAALGALVLGEPVTRRRLIASATVLAGLIVLRF